MLYQIDVDVILISHAVEQLWKYLSFLIPEFGQTNIWSELFEVNF